MSAAPSPLPVVGMKPWLTGEIGITKTRSERAEITAIIRSLQYAQEQISYSNYECGNIDKAIKLLRSFLPKRRKRGPPDPTIAIPASAVKPKKKRRKKSKIIAGLEDAVAFAKGDKTRGRIVKLPASLKARRK